MNPHSEQLKAELARRAAQGHSPCTVAHMVETLRALGYCMDRTMDCAHVATWRTGPGAGESYPCISTGLREIDTGLSAFNVDARRDANFAALQALRFSGELFAIVRGSILEI